MVALFSDDFVKSLKKHAALKSSVRKKVDMILANPIAIGEPLKGTFRGYYSAPVKKHFIIRAFCKTSLRIGVCGEGIAMLGQL